LLKVNPQTRNEIHPNHTHVPFHSNSRGQQILIMRPVLASIRIWARNGGAVYIDYVFVCILKY